MLFWRNLAASDGAVRGDDGLHPRIGGPALEAGNPPVERAPFRHDRKRRLGRIPGKQQAPLWNEADAAVGCVARQVMEDNRHRSKLHDLLIVEYLRGRHQAHIVPRAWLGGLHLVQCDWHVGGEAFEARAMAEDDRPLVRQARGAPDVIPVGVAVHHDEIHVRDEREVRAHVARVGQRVPDKRAPLSDNQRATHVVFAQRDLGSPDMLIKGAEGTHGTGNSLFGSGNGLETMTILKVESDRIRNQSRTLPECTV